MTTRQPRIDTEPMDTPDQRGAAVTVLRTLGPLLAKRWLADGTIKSYDLARNFHVAAAEVPHLRGLYNLLNKLRTDPRRCIVRGTPHVSTLGQAGLFAPQERNLDNFFDAPSPLFMVDVDEFDCMIEDPLANPAGAVAEFVATLPACFRGVSYIWQLSGSAGHPSKPPARLRAHLWFWLDAPLTCAQAEAWSRAWLPVADATVHRTVQVNYTADPVMDEGVADPLAGLRFGAHKGERVTLALPADMPVPDVQQAAGSRAQRRVHVDPRGKLGVVGAVCRAFIPEQITELFPDLFEAPDEPTRITWRAGGGTAGGVFVTTDGLHLGNSHHTSPTGERSANLFDFIRLHAFGHLDDGMDPEALALDPTALPSYQATAEWARTQPEVIEQLALDRPEAVEQVEAARDAAADKKIEQGESREQRMTNLLALVAAAETLDALEFGVARKVARIADLTDSEREALAGAIRLRTIPLLRPIAGNSRGLNLSMVRRWLQPVRSDGNDIYPDRDPETQDLIFTPDNVRVLCQRLAVQVRFNVITKREEVIAAERNMRASNYADTVITWLWGQATKAGMRGQRASMASVITMLADENPYNPVAEWIESAPWDGIERIADLARTIDIAEGFSQAKCELYLRRWLIQCVAAALSPQPLQLRGVLVFQGPQYIGKTRWLQRLCSPGHERLVLTGHHLEPANKDSVKIAVSHWITELGELGSVVRKVDRDALKAFIGMDVDTFRLPYAAREAHYQRQTSFAASVNDDTFLDDPTGSSRFWTVPVVGMQPDHDVDMQQVWAQAMALWRAGEPHFMTAEEMDQVQAGNVRFEIEDSIHERLAGHYAWHAWGTDKAEPKRVTATDALRDIGFERPSPGETKRASNALKKLGAKKLPRGTGGVRGWLVPVPVQQNRSFGDMP